MVIERGYFRPHEKVPPSGQAPQDDAPAHASDFLISITYSDDSVEMRVAGDLDFSAARRLREAIELCVDTSPESIRLDGLGIGRAGVAGLTALADTTLLCKQQGVKLDLELSASARRALDRAGLWWLGIIDDAPRLEEAIKQARSAYTASFDLGGKAVSEPDERR